jgi:hypothetical protein
MRAEVGKAKKVADVKSRKPSAKQPRGAASWRKRQLASLFDEAQIDLIEALNGGARPISGTGTRSSSSTPISDAIKRDVSTIPPWCLPGSLCLGS